jgi:hypothetical protein
MTDDVPIILIINAFDHPNVCKFPTDPRPFTPALPSLKFEVEKWIAENTEHGATPRQCQAANFLLELVFQCERDATLFKLFWL